MEHYEEFLDKAEPADPCGGVEAPGPGQDGPGDPVGPAHVLQFPHMGGQRGLVLLVPVPKVSCMRIESRLEPSLREPGVSLLLGGGRR